MKDFHSLPRVEDSLSYLYLEHGRLEQDGLSLAFYDADGGKTAIPVAALCIILLGPGTTVTHAAVKVSAENGCLLNWTGESGVRYYASGYGETRKAKRLIRQAFLVSHPKTHLAVVYRMYEKRLGISVEPGTTLNQLRGKEGVRVRTMYDRLSKETGVPWHGRKYDSKNWGAADPVNRALSAANACLYGVCHAAIVTAGYSPGLGFIHKGRYLSFVYDIADLYKADISIPIAFRVVADEECDIASRVRFVCRDYFRESKLLNRILPDIEELFGEGPDFTVGTDPDGDGWTVGDLWDPEDNEDIKGGRAW